MVRIDRDKHRAVILVALVALMAVVMVSCVKEEFVSQNVWALGFP
jgi:hypothetical protein